MFFSAKITEADSNSFILLKSKTTLKKVILSVTNDLVTDNRVHKVASSLQKMGFDILLVGRKLPESKPITNRTYKTHRMKLLFRKGPLFYAEYNIRLLLFLLFRKAGILLANDLDSLPANYLASVLKRTILVYDSHELFTEIPELISRPKVRSIWYKIEKSILPKIKHAYTVSESIAAIYRQKYGVPFKVVRNLPERTEKAPVSYATDLRTDDRLIILYQGALNIGRGLEYAIKAMTYTDGARLIIAGDGDIAVPLKQLTVDLGLVDRVTFLGKIPLEDIKFITTQADLGLSIEEDMGLNYRFALPNKLFDYIQQQIPVMVGDLPEMRKIVDNYQIGMILKSHEPQQMAEQFHEALFDEEKRNTWKANLKIAANELCWENEEKVLAEIFGEMK
jgi:glycosyltransferase involved in cell wall biosynthesis